MTEAAAMDDAAMANGGPEQAHGAGGHRSGVDRSGAPVPRRHRHRIGGATRNAAPPRLNGGPPTPPNPGPRAAAQTRRWTRSPHGWPSAGARRASGRATLRRGWSSQRPPRSWCVLGGWVDTRAMDGERFGCRSATNVDRGAAAAWGSAQPPAPLRPARALNAGAEAANGRAPPLPSPPPQDDADQLAAAYESLLAEWPLCYGYWKRYADALARHGRGDAALQVTRRAARAARERTPRARFHPPPRNQGASWGAAASAAGWLRLPQPTASARPAPSTPIHPTTQVLERGAAAVPYSVPLWEHYVSHLQARGATPEAIRRWARGAARPQIVRRPTRRAAPGPAPAPRQANTPLTRHITLYIDS